jgi:hypothetical protein
MSLFFAGFLAGFAVITDYPAVFTAAGLLVYPVWCGCPLRRMLPCVAAAGLCAVGLMTYHKVCFGGAFQTGYPYMAHPMFHDVYSPEHPMGLVRPTWESISGILFSKHRGLIWFAPVVVMAPFGLWMLYRRGEIRLTFMVLLAFGSYFLVNASHVTWDGGASTGPRYLMPALPFLMLAVAACVAGIRPSTLWLLGVLTLIGFVICGSCTLTRSGGRMPTYQLVKAPGAEDPLREVVLPDVLAGRMTQRNLGNVLLYGQWEVRLAGNWLAALPLLDFQILFVSILLWMCRRERTTLGGEHFARSPVF